MYNFYSKTEYDLDDVLDYEEQDLLITFYSFAKDKLGHYQLKELIDNIINLIKKEYVQNTYYGGGALMQMASLGAQDVYLSSF